MSHAMQRVSALRGASVGVLFSVRHSRVMQQIRWLTNSKKRPSLVFANSKGEMLDFPELEPVGRSGLQVCQIDETEWIPIPEGSEMFALPQRYPLGYHRESNTVQTLHTNPFHKARRLGRAKIKAKSKAKAKAQVQHQQAEGEEEDICQIFENNGDFSVANLEGQKSKGVQAVAAYISPAHTHLYSSAYVSQPDAPTLPLLGYCAVGWLDGQFVVSAVRVDQDQRQDFKHFDMDIITDATNKKMQENAENRLIQHLGHCALEYGCACSKNYFMGRWEAPLPVSSLCNTRCVGCISLQADKEEGVNGQLVSSQDRISFTPTPEEIAGVAVPHLENAPHPVVSFGQGCEGEPLLQALVIEQAIRLIRKQTSKGTINMNTNGTMPKRVQVLREAGLDSIRVSLNSVRDKYYQRYYRPHANMGVSILKQSIINMKKSGGFASINYLFTPGMNDEQEEFDELCRFVDETGLDLIQMRNLNIDHDYYLKKIGFEPTSNTLGVQPMMLRLKEIFPHLQFGYFNPCLNNGEN